MIPEPMPWVGWPNGEKRSVVMPSAVIVTTDSLAFATIEVRSSEVTVVLPVLVAWAAAGATVAAGGRGQEPGDDGGGPAGREHRAEDGRGDQRCRGRACRGCAAARGVAVTGCTATTGVAADP